MRKQVRTLVLILLAAGLLLLFLRGAHLNEVWSEIKEAIISALYEAFDAGTELGTDHVLHALRETVPLAKTMDEQINRLRSWAEGRARNASVAHAPGADSQLRRMEF